LDPDATAQATETATVSQSTAEQTQTPEQVQQDNSGFQKRINELTAARHQAEEEARRQAAQNQELMTAILSQQARPAAPAEAAPEFDPEEKRKFDYLLGPMVQRMEQMQRLMEQQVGQVQLRQSVQRVADPEIAREAESLYQKWARRDDVKGFNADDAVIYAAGKKYLAAQQAARASHQGLQDFNNGAAPPMIQGRPPPAAASLEPAVPGDIDSWSPEKQADYWEKQLGGKSF